MNMQINETVTLRDKESFVRKNLFRMLALNSVDGMRFYEFLIGVAQRISFHGPQERQA